MKKAGLLKAVRMHFSQLLKGQRPRPLTMTTPPLALGRRLRKSVLRPFHWLALVGVRLMLASPLAGLPIRTRRRWEAVLLTVTGVVAVVGVTMGSWRALNQEMLQSAASSTAYMVEEGLIHNDHAAVRNTLRRLSWFSGVSSVRVYDAEGGVFERWHSAGIVPRDEDQQRFLNRMLDMEIYLPIMDGEHAVGGVLVTAHAEHMLKTLREALLLSGILSGVLALVIFVAYRRMRHGRRKPASAAAAVPSDAMPASAAQGAHASLLEGMLNFKSEIDTAYTRLLFQATHDALTRVYNRFYFDLFFEHAMNYGRENDERFGLIFIDCNRFKAINDQHGHLCGDQVLQEVARRLNERFEGIGDVFRYGGDEFAVLIHTLLDDAYLQTLVDEVPRLFDEPIRVESIDEPLSVGVACGGACYPTDGNTARQLMHSADGRMYDRKER